MFSLTDAHGEFIDFFSTDGDALVYAVDNGIAAPFTITNVFKEN